MPLSATQHQQLTTCRVVVVLVAFEILSERFSYFDGAGLRNRSVILYFTVRGFTLHFANSPRLFYDFAMIASRFCGKDDKMRTFYIDQY